MTSIKEIRSTISNLQGLLCDARDLELDELVYDTGELLKDIRQAHYHKDYAELNQLLEEADEFLEESGAHIDDVVEDAE